MAKAQPTLPDDVLLELEKTFTSKPESHARILFFLSDNQAKGTAGPYLRSLKAVIKLPKVFAQVAERMDEDTRTAENDHEFKQFMYNIWNNFLKENMLTEETGGQKWEIALQNPKAISTAAQFSFIRAIANLPPDRYLVLHQMVGQLGGTSAVALYGQKAIAAARAAKPVVKVALVAVFLAVDIIINVRRWWKGEISGKRCVKNIIDNGLSVAAGLAGGVGGEIAGLSVGAALGGPVGAAFGAVVGAVAGGALGANLASILADKLTQWIFGLPKSEALENAYNFLRLPAKSSNSEINSRYRHLALEHHPDKGGDRDKWTQLQYSMAVIREARGEV